MPCVRIHIYDDSCGTGCSLLVLVAPMDEVAAPGAVFATVAPQSSRFWGLSQGLFRVSQDQLLWGLLLCSACGTHLIVFYRKSFYCVAVKS